MANPSLIELFREEALSHVRTLAAGLVELEQGPTDARRIEPLMRAAHSVKGAARAVDVGPAVKIAHEIEDCLVGAQKGRVRLTAEAFDFLLRGAELLEDVVTAAGPGLAEWSQRHRDRIQALLDSLQGFASGDAPTPRASIPEADEPVPTSTPDWSAGGQTTAAPLLELFRQEVHHGTQMLSAEPGQTQLAPVAHALRGAARMVKVAPVAHLAEALETALQQGRGSEHDVLRACEWMVNAAEAAGPNYPEWLASNADELHNVWAALARSTEPQRAVVPRPMAIVTQELRPLPPGPVEATTTGEQERVVRVTAQSLTRLMGLAGESLVEARWLQPFADALLNLKRQQAILADETELLAEQPDSDSPALLMDVRRRLAHCRGVLNDRITEFENHARKADDLNSRLYREVIASRMRPFRDGVQGFPLLVRNLARELGKSARLEIIGDKTEVDRDILDKLDAPLTHLLRNAVDHGLEVPPERLASGKPETGRLVLEARHDAGMLSIQVRDDGRGIDLERLRRKIVEKEHASADMAEQMSEAELLEFLFLPGFSTREQVTEVSGRGVGLDVVYSMIHGVGGSVRIHTELGRGTRFLLQLPLTLSVIRAVLVEIAGEPYAFPLNRIDRLLCVPPEHLHSLEHRQFFEMDGRNVGVVLARQVLDLEPLPQARSASQGQPARGNHDDLDVVVFSNYAEQYGLIVDRFLGEHDLVVRPLDPRLGKVPNIHAAAILDDGSPVLLVDLDDLRRGVEKLLTGGRLRRTARRDSPQVLRGRAKRILVVDDSITVRETERQLLALAGYTVEVAVDGIEGWNAVRESTFDLVITDVDMPRMNGLELVRAIKNDARHQSTPVIIVSYKDREEDRWKGLDAGANYYLTKSSFHDDTFLGAVKELIGEAIE